jgi:hypothetical protein
LEPERGEPNKPSKPKKNKLNFDYSAKIDRGNRMRKSLIKGIITILPLLMQKKR